MPRVTLALLCVPMLLSMACECQETVAGRGIPDHMSLTLWGMASDEAVESGVEVWGESQYAVDVPAGERPTATLRLGSGDIDLALLPLDDVVALAGETAELPLLAIELEQPVAPHPGAARTLVRSDFGAARARAIIDGTVYVDEAPQVVVALDLATGATEVTASGLLRRVAGAQAPDRPYAIEGHGISPIDCIYREAGEAYGGSYTPPEGQDDICRALVSEAVRMPVSAATPPLPWDPGAPDVHTICGL